MSSKIKLLLVMLSLELCCQTGLAQNQASGLQCYVSDPNAFVAAMSVQGICELKFDVSGFTTQAEVNQFESTASAVERVVSVKCKSMNRSGVSKVTARFDPMAGMDTFRSMLMAAGVGQIITPAKVYDVKYFQVKLPNPFQ